MCEANSALLALCEANSALLALCEANSALLAMCEATSLVKCEAFCGGIHTWSVDSPHKGPLMGKVFLCYDVIATNQPWFIDNNVAELENHYLSQSWKKLPDKIHVKKHRRT